MFNFRCTYWKLDIIWIVYDNIKNKMLLGKGEKGTTETDLLIVRLSETKPTFKTNTVLFPN